jgi:starvation-inducible DNA-binding protein
MATETTTGAGSVASALEDLLCNVIVFYFSAHRAHWNVTGPDFSEYHELFGLIYDDVYDSVDDLAENIRKCGSFPPSLSDMVEDAAFKDDSMTTDAKELALDIYKKNVVMIAMLKGAFDVANAANEQGVANFIAERIDMHQKWQWQLGSSLQTAGMEIPGEAPAHEVAEEMSGPMDSSNEETTETIETVEVADSVEVEEDTIETTPTEEITIEDSAEHKELGKKLDVTAIEDAVDTTPEYWTSTERRIASKYKELRNHDINKAETYLIDQIRSGFVSRKFNPLEVKA